MDFETRPTLTIGHEPGNRFVVMRLTGLVSEPFSLRAQVEFGVMGRPNQDLQVDLARFLSRLSWLPGMCIRSGVSIRWTGDAEDLVRARTREAAVLGEVLLGKSDLDAEDVAGALEGGRFVRDLKPFQIRDLGRLLALPHGANFSVPGAGKTAVALAAYEATRLAGKANVLLVVAPLSAFESWETEAELSMSPSPRVAVFQGRQPGANVELLLVNYQRLSTGFPLLSAWLAQNTSYLILDEAHRMKRGWNGEWGTACLSMARLAAHRSVLTGTPAPNSVEDLLSLLDFLWPDQARRILPSRASQSQRRASEAGEAISPLFTRTTKSELGLPEPSVRLVRHSLSPLHAEIYESLRGLYTGSIPITRRGAQDLRRLGAVLMYLLEAATNPALLVAGSHRYDPIQFRHPPLPIPIESSLNALLADYHDYEVPWKLVEVRRIVDENAADNRKTIVWSHFVRSLESLYAHELVDLHPAMVHGGVVAERKNELDRFRHDPDCQILLANPAALGEGISLHTACQDAIYLDRTFNAAQYLQSVDRIHRLGLAPDADVRVTILSSMNTVDDIVNSRLEQKAINLGRMLNDPAVLVMSLPSEFEEGLDDPEDTGFEDKDLEELLRHLEG